jgi:hypothetical protein
MGIADGKARLGGVNELLVGGRGDELSSTWRDDELPSAVLRGSSAVAGRSLEESMCVGVCSGEAGWSKPDRLWDYQTAGVGVTRRTSGSRALFEGWCWWCAR